ncbi:MAG: RsmB/NOP family class I SAM-dependent RNA methyltransferase [Ignavibacteriae bacterium]|nr:RsmB/NOP family class I SAM-dependent RNA methyltransferase [Ignavibacteriota bacterium]
MKKTSLVGHVVELFELIRPLKNPVDSTVQEFFRNRRYLGSKDRRFISETLYGILRNYKLLRVYVEAGMQSVEPTKLPAVGLYIAYALRVLNEPRESVLLETEGFWRLAFPKSDIREFIEPAAAAELPDAIKADDAKRIAVVYSFPDSVVENWIAQFGVEEAERLCAALNVPAPTVVRVNTLKTSVDECRALLEREGIQSERTKLSNVGLVLGKRINAQSLRAFKDGWFEMQDEGSQLLSVLVQPAAGQVIVDACAGGGGKTLHLAAMMNNEGTLYSFDVDQQRLANIRPRLTRAGVSIAQLHNVARSAELLNSLAGVADSVLVDAPCTGTGTFRRNPAAKLVFDPASVERLAMTQLSVLEANAPLVKSGGRLVYTTCTLMSEENENVVAAFLQRHPEFNLISAADELRRSGVNIEKHRVETSSEFLKLLPHEIGTDGFFAAVMQKLSLCA